MARFSGSRFEAQAGPAKVDLVAAAQPDAAPVAARHFDAAVLAEDSRAVPAGVVDDPELAPGLGGPDRGVRATDGAAADESTEHEGETVEAVAEEVEVEDPDLEPGEELEAEDLASDVDPMLDPDVPEGEAEGVLEGDE